jgi:phage FluMu protein Com
MSPFMSYSLTPIRCTHCNSSFEGFKQGTLDVNATYEADCPNCKASNALAGIGAFSISSPPTGSVPLREATGQN